jgi:hypothetical protein
VFGGRLRDDFTELLPQVALTISQRPRLVERLLALERSFHESKNLGEFLRRQDVLRDAPTRSTTPWIVAAFAGGVALGLLLDRLL